MADLTYHWQNLETKGTGVSKFNASHDPMFAQPRHFAPATLDKKADALIAEWNWQQPKTWKYWR